LKLLADENLSPRLVDDLADLFPGSVHVRAAGLGSADDRLIWDYAKQHAFTFVTKDKDFAGLSITLGAPPKVILIQIGNCSSTEVVSVMRGNAVRLAEFENDEKRSLLILR
jgi:predicted nuclease of predicted toxin-antitoxin system